jgi:hypothetical protein
MFKQLGQSNEVPDEIFKSVLDMAGDRLTNALNVRITPRALYNKIAPPDLTKTAPDNNWSQPLSILLQSARLLRELLTDGNFSRRLSSLSFSEDELCNALDVFGDSIIENSNKRRAQRELEALSQIESNSEPAKKKCAKVWKVIKGDDKK